MHADGEPAWLVAWRERDHQPQAPKQPKPRRPAPPRDAPYTPLRMKGQAAAIGIIEPDAWPFDGCVRREPVTDMDIPGRVVRRVGWHRCLKCRRPFSQRTCCACACVAARKGAERRGPIYEMS
jgi:hypothetical protein